MCGIAGVFYFNGEEADTELIRRMTATLAHRGPDGDGHHVQGPIRLGHRRLAIIDLSPTGKQPMGNEDGSIWITFNGEIYNFADIRADLEHKGHRFRSSTDTEVIVHAYEEWGTHCLQRLNGMFAFGLWDDRRKRLWLVRDRLGVKPLFYSHSHRGLLFGSEIKAILCDPVVDRSLDYEALAYYLALNYTPAPHTLFANIRQILPGHYLLVEASGRIENVEYWDVVYHEGVACVEQQTVEKFAALLEDSVKLRLVSDVPFGAFLSGGLDSSSVAFWMSRNMREPVKTFSIGFGEETFDELVYAREVADRIGAEAHERIVSADVADVLPKLVYHAEEPTADSSMVAVYHLAKTAREHVTMVLSGDGADEIIAGYETYQAYYGRWLYRLLPRWLRQHVIAPLVNLLPASDAKVSWDFKLRRFVSGAEHPAEDAHAIWRMIFDPQARERLLQPVRHYPGAQANVVDLYRAHFARTNARHPLNRMLYVDTRFYLPNDMLVKVDRMTMAHGLEAREPYLDFRLVEFAASLPPQLKLKNLFQKKYILKAAMKGRLPDRILKRKKAGFNVPNARWIKKDLKSFATDHLSPARMKDIAILDPQSVASLLGDHFSEKTDNSHQIWSVLTLALWWERFMK